MCVCNICNYVCIYVCNYVCNAHVCMCIYRIYCVVKMTLHEYVKTFMRPQVSGVSGKGNGKHFDPHLHRLNRGLL